MGKKISSKHDVVGRKLIYQIYPTAIGDLRDIKDALPLIAKLKPDYIWLNPIFVSPWVDGGYDVADYCKIDPRFGTMADFKRLVAEAKKYNIGILLDLVLNHTSNQHPWFQKSIMHDSWYKDYYVWLDKPLNWNSFFGGPAFDYEARRGEYYLHLFAKGQPDLNMDNPKVRQEVVDIQKFWLDMGVDGFREDVITFISKKEGLPNGSIFMPCARGLTRYMNGPHIHEYLTQFKKEGWGNYDAMTVGEAPMMTPKTALKYITEGPNQELNMMFNFQHMEADCFLYSWVYTGFHLRKLKKALTSWQTKLYGKAWNANYMENHDQPRVISRYGSEKMRSESGKAIANMFLFLGGTPFIYQGQEIGMTSIHLPNLEDYVDVSTITMYKLFRKFGFSHDFVMKRCMYSSRDNARTPVQWSAGKNAGFTDGEKAWFKINPNYTDVNVESQQTDPDSLLNFYRQLLKIRKENPIVIYGDYKLHYKSSKKLYVYERNLDGKRLLVVTNMSAKPCTFKAPKGFDLEKGKLLVSSYGQTDAEGGKIALKPYEARTYLFE